jgi:hypothetical protein
MQRKPAYMNEEYLSVTEENCTLLGRPPQGRKGLQINAEWHSVSDAR